MTTATRPARHRIGITVVTGRERLLALCRELPRDPATGKRRRLDKSDRIKSKAREKFEDALAEYRRTGKIKTCKSPLLRDRLGRWLNGYKRPMVKTRVYETCRSDCRNIIAVIGSVQLEDLVPWRVREMGNKIMRDCSSKTALNAYIRLRSALADAHVAGGERFALTSSEPVTRNGVHSIMVMHELQRYQAGSIIHGSWQQDKRAVERNLGRLRGGESGPIAG